MTFRGQISHYEENRPTKVADILVETCESTARLEIIGFANTNKQVGISKCFLKHAVFQIMFMSAAINVCTVTHPQVG
jgi:hypothetical protein